MVPWWRAEPAGGGARSAALPVALADVAQPSEAVQVIEMSIAVKVSTVLVSWTQTVIGPAVGLTRFPAPGTTQNMEYDDFNNLEEMFAVSTSAAVVTHLRFMMYGVWLTHSHFPVLPSVRPIQ